MSSLGPLLSRTRIRIYARNKRQSIMETRAWRARRYISLWWDKSGFWAVYKGYVGNFRWVFPSFRLEGKQPRVANMLVEDHLRPAAVKAGALSSHRDHRGRLIDDDPRRFGFHNL